MGLLRKVVQYCFGVQAVGSLLGVSSIVILLLKHGRDLLEMESRIAFGFLVATNAIFALFGTIPAIAWWTLKSGRKSGRIWALAASLVSLPIPILSAFQPWWILLARFHVPHFLPGTLVGVAGLVAFWKSEHRVTAPKPKPVRIAGDGTSKVKDWIAQGASIAIVWVGFGAWGRWATAHHLVYPSLVPFIALTELAVLLTTLGHELGHLVAGWASHKRLRSFQVGPFLWAIRNGVWRFSFNLRKFYGGAVGMVAPDLKNMRSRKAFSLIGGPVASLLMGSIFVVVTMFAPGHAWQHGWLLSSMLATFSLSAFVVNLIPLKPESAYSDGAQLYQIVTNGPWARVHFAFAMVTASLVAAVRPRDFDVSVIHRAAESMTTGERGLLLRLFAALHYADRGWIPEAVVSMEQAEALYDQSKFEKPRDICAEFVFMNAFYKRDLAAAEVWWQRIEASRIVDADADYWRGKTALHWLKGERALALEAWERGNALAQKLPSAGSYEFTRSCFARLRAALDAPVESAPPPLESLNALAAACDFAALPMVAAHS
jgi:hypothetical protein